MEYIGSRVILNHLVDQHRNFFPHLPYVVVATVDSKGHVWGTMLAGNPGFLQAPDQFTLRVAAKPEASDPARDGLGEGNAVGLLGIDLRTRRRNRLNGKVRRANANTFDVAVEQSYGNCSQYIHIRDFSFARDPSAANESQVIALHEIDERAARIINEASTFFIASYVDLEEAGRQVDVSHKGGRPGFVQVGEDGTLTIPDFAGNRYFNTLGNILVNPECGLVFVDFGTGDMLQLSGEGEVIFDSPEIAAFQGAERLIRFSPRSVIFRPNALPIRWGAEPRMSPSVSITGNWSEASGRLRAEKLRSTWRGFTIGSIVEESSTIRSLYLEPADGAGLVPQKAGQYLPIRVRLPDAKRVTLRNYTLSCAPSDGVYRLSVKRDGAVSRYLHSLKVGDRVEALEPAGEFTIDADSHRLAVYLAAGIGITPMLAMLRHTVYEGQRTGRIRPGWLVYAAGSKEERAFDPEINSLLQAANGALYMTRVLSDPSTAERGDYEVAGRIDPELLGEALPFDGYDLSDGYDFYLCGPGSFMQDLSAALKRMGVPDKRIHTEVFESASANDHQTSDSPLTIPATKPVQVTFAKSKRKMTWNPGDGTLLEFAKSSGISTRSSCCMGVCGTCRTTVSGGQVAYRSPPAAGHAQNEALICCAVPASTAEDEGGLTLDL
jgi:hypothetical protein